MTATLIILAIAALFAALGGGLALGLHLFKRSMPRKKRIAWSAGLAAILPMIVPLVAFLIEGVAFSADEASEMVIGTLAILSTTAIAGFVLCLPAAWWVTTKLAVTGGDNDDGEDLPLLEDTHQLPETVDVTVNDRMAPQAS